MKENFDDILKRRWEERQFPVDENHRAEMIHLLNGNKRRRIFPFWWLGGLLVVMALSGYFLYTELQTPRPEVKDQEGVSHETLPVTDIQKDAEGTGNKTSDAESSQSNSLKSPSAEIHAKSQNIQTDIKTNSTSNLYPQQNQYTTSNPSTAKKTTTQKSTNPSATEVMTSADEKNPSLPVQGHYTVDEESAKRFQIYSQPVAVIVEPDDYYDQQTSNPSALTEASSPAMTEARFFVDVDFLDPLPVSAIPVSVAPAMGMIEPSVSSRKSFYVFGETGAGMILASKPDFSSGWKFKVGGGLGYSLGPKIQLNWSAGYMLQSGGFDYERTSTVTQAGFGVRSSFNSLSPDKLHYVYTKLGAQYRIHRNIFSAHGGIQWLYGTQGDIVVHTIDQFASDTETSNYAWLKTDGLREIRWTGDLYYGYQISPRVSIMAGTDIYFSSFTVEDAALKAEGYYWNGEFATFHPTLTLNYLIYGHL